MWTQIKHRKRVEPQREETLKIQKKWLSLCKFSPNIQTEWSSQVGLPYSREQILLFMFSNWLISSAIPLFFVFRCLGWASPLSTSFCYFTLRPIWTLGSSFLCLRVLYKLFSLSLSSSRINPLPEPLCHASVIISIFHIKCSQSSCAEFFFSCFNHQTGGNSLWPSICIKMHRWAIVPSSFT